MDEDFEYFDQLLAYWQERCKVVVAPPFLTGRIFLWCVVNSVVAVLKGCVGSKCVMNQ